MNSVYYYSNISFNVNEIFHKNYVVSDIEIKGTNRNKSALLHEFDQRFFPIRDVVPFDSQGLEIPNV